MPLTNFTYHYRLPPSATLNDLDETYTDDGDLLFGIEREGYRIRIPCNTEFIAQGADYIALKALLDADPCDDVEFVIALSASEVWAGQLNLKKARWFPDTCTVRFKPDLEDEYNCLYENWEDEENIFSMGTPVQAETFYGTLVEVTCGPVNEATPIDVFGYFDLFVSGCLADFDAYAHKRYYIEEITPGSSYDHYATWVTEQAVVACSGGVPVPPPGDGWVLLINDCGGSGNATWGRPPQTEYAGEFSATSGKYWDAQFTVIGGDVDAYDNGILLEEILDFFADVCSLTVKSDFFNINPPGTAPANTAYTASAALHSIIVFQKSDVKRPDASNPATVAYLKFKDLLEYLADMLNVFWRLEDAGASIRIEHVSYFEGANGDDLTVDDPGAVEAFNNFTFDADKLAPRDEFTWMDDTIDADFRGRPITYPTPCVDPALQPRQFSLSQVFTDLGKCEADPDNVSDEGLFFMATDEIGGTYYINREYGELSGDLKPNAHLSWANLHENYHTWGRPIASGTLNNVLQAFNSYKRSKRQQAISAHYTPAEFFALDFSDKIKTELGWGEIDRATYSARACELAIEILHDD